MATGKRYYWIKLKDTFMTSDAVDFLMGQKDGANYVVLYQMLCLKTINTGGRLERTIGEVIIPYDEEKIQRDTKWFTIDTVRVALNLYKALGLIYADDNGTLVLSNYENLVGSETDWKAQKQAQRAKDLPKLQECKRLNSYMLMLPTGKTQYVDEKRYGGNGMLAFDLAGGRCEMCGSYDDLCIHHANGYSNDPDDLFVLCKSCHGKAHAPSTPDGWLQHNRVGCGQEGGQVHTDIRDKDIRYKEIKRTDTRDKEIKNTPPKSPSKGEGDESLEELFGYNEFLLEAVKDWLAYKKEKRQDYKGRGLQALLTQIKNRVAEYGENAVIDIIHESMAQNYQGILWDKLKQHGKSYGEKRTYTFADVYAEQEMANDKAGSFQDFNDYPN